MLLRFIGTAQWLPDRFADVCCYQHWPHGQLERSEGQQQRELDSWMVIHMCGGTTWANRSTDSHFACLLAEETSMPRPMPDHDEEEW